MKKSPKVLIVLIIALLLNSISAFAQPQQAQPNLKAKAALMIDLDTGEVIYEKNPDVRMAPASITKLMTYLLAIEATEAGKVNLEDRIVVSRNAATLEGSSLRLRTDEVIPFYDLLQSLLIVSANDGAVAVAEHVAGDVATFVNRMNERALELGMKDTIYLNVNGLPDGDDVPETGHFTTARDILTLSAYLINNHPDVIDITSKKSLDLDYRGYKRNNTNTLLQTMEKLDGFKTGWTEEAGYCLVSTMNITSTNSDGERFRLLAVILDSPTDIDRFRESRTLLEYGENNYLKKKIVEEKQVINSIKVLKGKEEKVNVIAKDRVIKVYDKNAGEITTKININESIRAPFDTNAILGTIEVYHGEQNIQSINLYPEVEVKKAGFFLTIKRFFAGLFNRK